jgi:hypothetical protein
MSVKKIAPATYFSADRMLKNQILYMIFPLNIFSAFLPTDNFDSLFKVMQIVNCIYNLHN